MNRPPDDLPLLRFTPSALAQASLLGADFQYASLKLRVYISDKNCDGFLYGVAFDDPLPGDHEIPLQGGVTAVVDQQGAPYLWGSVVDFVKTGEEEGFVVQNPNQSLYRGKFFLPAEKR